MTYFLFFHMNIEFSAINESDRKDVIEHSYIPLFNLIEKLEIKCGIEITGYTLEQIAVLNAPVIDYMRTLINRRLITLIGSGYAQIISVASPPSVTKSNIALGNKIYRRLFELQPDIFLLNEQVASRDLLMMYSDLGINKVILDRKSPGLDTKIREWSEFPYSSCSLEEFDLTIGLNDSALFQSFQRAVYGELNLTDYLEQIENITSLNRDPKAGNAIPIPLYGSDVEIFGFRPGRFKEESGADPRLDWVRMETLLRNIGDFGIYAQDIDDVFSMKAPVVSADLFFSAHRPIVEKKQPKYNVSRWLLSGWNDRYLNTLCWRYFKKHQHLALTNIDEREFLRIWASDFRTHISESRWKTIVSQLEKKVCSSADKEPYFVNDKNFHATDSSSKSTISRDDEFYLQIDTDRLRVLINKRRGWTLATVAKRGDDGTWNPIFGLVPQGTFTGQSHNVDYFSGHMQLITQCRNKFSDLRARGAKINTSEGRTSVEIIERFEFGNYKKTYSIKGNSLLIDYFFDFHQAQPQSLRYGYVTFFPSSRASSYKCACGYTPISYSLLGTSFDHSQPISEKVSVSTALPLTDETISFYGDDFRLKIDIDHAQSLAAGLVTSFAVPDSNRLIGPQRFCLSASELDDTAKGEAPTRFRSSIRYELE